MSPESRSSGRSPPHPVFSYLTDPAKFVAWMGTRAELDPRPGGRFRIEVEAGGVVVGEYREVDPPHRLVFSWGWEGDEVVPPGSTTVEITVVPAGSGSLLRLRHLGLPTEENRRLHQAGWVMYLDRLTGLLG